MIRKKIFNHKGHEKHEGSNNRDIHRTLFILFMSFMVFIKTIALSSKF